MYLKIILLNLIVLLFLTSCAFIPVTVRNSENKCDMTTKELTLSIQEIKGLTCAASSGNDLSGCLFALGVIPIGSLIVSGSIVLLGNTIHWLEYEGTCSEGFILKNINKLSENKQE